MSVVAEHRPSPTEPLELLAEGVPLSLLMDLVALPPDGSVEIYRTEGGYADWLPTRLAS